MKNMLITYPALLLVLACSHANTNLPGRPAATAAEQTIVMYAPDGALEEVPSSRTKFATEAGFEPVVWFLPPNHTRAFPVPNDNAQDMRNKGWRELDHSLSPAEARAEYFRVRPPRTNK